MDFIKKFDAYPRTYDEFTVKTHSGAIVSIIVLIFMSWLFISELNLYMTTDIDPELVIDTTRGEKLRINFDVVFHKMACSFISIDTMDIAGQHQLDVAHNIFKTRLNEDGTPKQTQAEKQNLRRDEADVNVTESGASESYCGNCYGAESKPGDCCNTCEDVREAYRRKGWAFSSPSSIEQCVKEKFLDTIKEQQNEGCKLFGYIMVNKVAGNFHFAPGKSFQSNHMHFHDMDVLKTGKGFNLSHTINRLSFGADYPGINNPLDGVRKSWTKEVSPMYQYFVKVVPTTYEDVYGTSTNTNQFSVTEYERALDANSQGTTGVYFMYELSPIRIIYRETSKSFAFFLTGVCAIIGGIFTVAGIVDSFIYRIRSFKVKVDLGKDL